MKKSDFKIFKKIPTLNTERLALRKILKSDLEDVYEYASDPSVSEFLTWYPHKNIQYTREYLKYLQVLYRKGKLYDWAVVINEKMIGTVGFSRIDIKKNCAEIGYVINKSFWGRGIAAEAVREILNFAFSLLNFDKVYAVIMSENIGSERVLTKCCFKKEASCDDTMIIKGAERNIKTFSVLKDDYLRNKT